MSEGGNQRNAPVKSAEEAPADETAAGIEQTV